MARLHERYALESTDAIYLFRAEISNDQLDSHFTHMAESTLRNYAADATAGVAFLKGHNWRELPIGYSLNAAYEDGGRKRVVTDFYTVGGLPETNDLILRMKSGLLRDVSVGFHGGEMSCDLCSRGFWDCPHIPGLKYEIKEGDTVRSKLATFTIEDARLSEVSGVFDGSTPGAMILKAQERAAELSPSQVRILEQRYRVTLPATKRAFAGVDTRAQTPREQGMTEDELNRIRKVLSVELRSMSEEEAREIGETELPHVIETLASRVKNLEPQAADGRAYRTDLIATALAEGVRAHGNDFDKPTYEAMLTNAPLATIKRMAADWQKTADAVLPAGRHTVDDDQTPAPQTKTVSRVPDAAYAA